MVMDNPDLDGATPKESSEENGQVAEPTLADILSRMERMEQGWEDRFNRVFNGMQSTTQREVGRVATQIVALESQIGELTTKAEITRRVLEQGYDDATVKNVQDAVQEERRVKELEKRAAAKDTPPPDNGVLSDAAINDYWRGADQRLVEASFEEGMLSTADISELVDGRGQPRAGHEEEMAWYRSMIPGELGEPATLAALERFERRIKQAIKADAEKKARGRKAPVRLPNDKPVATHTRDWSRTSIRDIPDEEFSKNWEEIAAQRALALQAKRR